MKTGKLIKKFRSEKQVSVSKLAKEISVSRSYLSMIEHGHEKPSKKLIKKISSFLSLKDNQVAQLLHLTGYDLRGMVGQDILIPRSENKPDNSELRESRKEVKPMEIKTNGNSTKPSQIPQQIEIKLREGQPITYTDIAVINSNQNGLVINFGQLIGALPQAEITLRVGMSLDHAKALIHALEDNLKKAEEKKKS